MASPKFERAIWSQQATNDLREAITLGMSNTTAKDTFPSLAPFTSSQIGSKRQSMAKLKKNHSKQKKPIVPKDLEASSSSSESARSDMEEELLQNRTSKKRKNHELKHDAKQSLEADFIWDLTHEEDDHDMKIPQEQIYTMNPKKKIPWMFIVPMKKIFLVQIFPLPSGTKVEVKMKPQKRQVNIDMRLGVIIFEPESPLFDTPSGISAGQGALETFRVEVPFGSSPVNWRSEPSIDITMISPQFCGIIVKVDKLESVIPL